MSATATFPSKAVQALLQSSHPVLRRITVEETEEKIVLTGRVRSYYLKQLAQETVMAVRGPRELVNQVSVACE